MNNNDFKIFDLSDNDKYSVGRPKLADSKTKRKSLIFAIVSLFIVALLFVFGYSSLFNVNPKKLIGSLFNKGVSQENVLMEDISPIIKDVKLKEGTTKKIYVKIAPTNATNKDIKYSSSDESIVTVDKNGNIFGVSIGNATITAITADGSDITAEFNITVLKNASGICKFSKLNLVGNEINYEISCDNAKIKAVEFKTDKTYKSLVSKKSTGTVKLSDDDIKKDINFKVIYYPNSSKVTKYSIKTLKNKKEDKIASKGMCEVNIKEINSSSCKYDITCENATVSNIAYKIGNGSYIGIEKSNLADTIFFEEQDVTRVIYIKVNYKIDGTDKTYESSKSSVIDKKIEKD